MAKQNNNRLSDAEWYQNSRMHNILNLLPVVLFSAISILIVRAHYYSDAYTQFFWTEKTDSSVLTDFFSYNKLVVIAISAGLAAIIVLFRILLGLGKPKMHQMYLFMGGYLALVLLSCLFSEYRHFAWIGFKERFEGTLAILSYIVMLFYIINSVDTERAAKGVFWAVACSMLILGILGLFQGIGLDFFRTNIGQKMISPNANLVGGGTVWEAIDKASAEGNLYYNFTFALGDVYQTVFNLNYVPYYLQLVLPLFAVTFIWFWTDGKLKGAKKYLLPGFVLLLYALSLFSLFGAKSASGYFGLGLMVIITPVIFRKQLKKSIKPIIAIVLTTVIIMGIQQRTWWPEIRAKVFERTPAAAPVDPGVEPSPLDTLTVDKVLTGDDWFMMTISGQTFYGRTDGGEFHFEDADGKGLALIPDTSAGEGHYVFEDPNYAKYTKVYFAMQNDNFYAVVMTNDHKSEKSTPEIEYKDTETMWSFRFGDDKVYFQTPVGKETPIGEVESWGFENRYGFGSGRGYIWARSLPMLKQNLLLGKGPDTYCIYFPQHDYAGKYTLQHSILKVTDKPHDMYLDIALGSGVPSLIIWLGMIVYYAVLSWRGCLKLRGKNSFIEYLGCACFIGVMCFLLVGIFNDTSVSVMPLFYTILGLGTACNLILGTPEKIGKK